MTTLTSPAKASEAPARGAVAPYRRILVALDGLDASNAAAELTGLARNDASEVILLRTVDSQYGVISRHMPAFGPIDPPVQEIMRGQRDEAENDLERASAALRASGVTRIERLIIEGDLGRAIVSTARERGCDAIVISHRGRSGVRAWLSGSVVQAVLRDADRATVHLVRVPDASPVHDRRWSGLDALHAIGRAVKARLPWGVRSRRLRDAGGHAGTT